VAISFDDAGEQGNSAVHAAIRPELILEAATDDSLFADLAALLARAVGARSGVLHWQGAQEGCEEASYSGHFSNEHMAAFSDHFSGDDLWASAISSPRAADRLWNCDDLVAPRIYERSRIYNEWIRPMGDDTFHCLGGVLRLGSVTAKLGFHRGRSQGPFHADDVATLSSYLGQIRQLVLIRGKLAAAAQRELELTAAQDAIGYGLLTLSLDGRVLGQNRAAEAMLRRGNGLTVRGGRLTAETSSDGRDLAAAISCAASSGVAEAGALRFPKMCGGHYEVSVVPSWSGGRRHIVVVVHDRSRSDPSLRHRLRAMYQLSNAEADIALQLAAGSSVAELAHNRRTGIGTVRNQIKSIAAKLGCSRQTEIAACIADMPRLGS
jgi:DNA-binding CsgD family transcriptional regulator